MSQKSGSANKADDKDSKNNKAGAGNATKKAKAKPKGEKICWALS